MNFEAQQVKNVSEQARKQRPYGTQKTLLFGLTMISFFIVTYMTITNFTFRAFCVRYLFYPLPLLLVTIGYGICAVCLVLAFVSFLVYFRIAKPIGKGLDITQLTRLGVKPLSKGKSGGKTATPSKTILPLPAWATDDFEEDVSAATATSKSASKSTLGSVKWFLTSSRSPEKTSSSSSPTSPKGRMRSSGNGSGGTSGGKSKSGGRPSSPGARSPTSPKENFAWLTRTSQTPVRLSSPMNYPKSIYSPGGGSGSGSGAGGGSGGSERGGDDRNGGSTLPGSPLSPNSYSRTYNAMRSFPKVESPMVKRVTTTATTSSPSYTSTPADGRYSLTGSSGGMRTPHQYQQMVTTTTTTTKIEPLIYPASPVVTAHSYNSPVIHQQHQTPYHTAYQTPGSATRRTPAHFSTATPSAASAAASPSNGFLSPTGTALASPASYASPRATSNFSIENYTSTMSPLSTTSHLRGPTGAETPSMSGRDAPNWDFSFADQSQLDEFVERQKRIETTKDYLDPESGGASKATYRPIKMPAYQSMAPRISSDKPSSSKEGSYNDDSLAFALYDKQGVYAYMDMWTENMRSWLSHQVLKPMIQWFEAVETHMGKDALYQAQFSQVQSGVQKLQTQQANMFSVKPTLMTGASATAASTQSQQQQQAHLAERMKIERLFGDFGSSREYVVERIRTLANGAVLQAYNWCGGGKWKDKDWSTDLPTDAHIICHLFCTHLDNLVVPTDAAHLHDAFRSRYLVGKDETAKKPGFAIVQKSVNPPHYNIVVGGTEWNVLKGRNNLFDALCLFLFVVRKDYKGVLDQRYLGGEIGLLELLTEEE